MKQFSVYLLLALHINFFMFLPQCPEMDVRDANGQQQEDINSLIEWANVALGIDTTPDDEDDDNGTNFIVLKNFDYKILQQQFQIITENQFSNSEEKIKFPTIQENICLDTFIEVNTPPPNYNS